MLLVLSIIFLLWLDVYNIIKNAIDTFNRVHFPIYIKVGYCIILILYSLKTSLFQKINGNVVKLSTHKYMVSYIIGGRLYQTIIPLKRGPRKILQILDINSNDVTIDVEPFCGPDETFRHSTELRPIDLGYEELTINLSDGETKKIGGGELLTTYCK
jgi:predicted membrane channel-forming protein YqfA (hemolysin III family)